ncbi:MAG: acyltransferase [Gammaproteobacteria bacterium]
MKFEIAKKNVRIIAKDIQIGESVVFGDNVDINVFGCFKIGNYSVLGSNAQIRGNNIVIGSHLFNSSGLRIGGGGRYHPDANLCIGDRCTIHNNFINVCENVTLGNDVGLSPDTSILTHGYWLSTLEGFPASFEPVTIGDGVIVGYRSLIMMGVSIASQCVIGAQSVVTKSLKQKGIYAGSPAKFIRDIVPMNREKREEHIYMIVKKYLGIACYHGLNPEVNIEYPFIQLNDFRVNVETFEYSGTEDKETDDFRDYIRKWGIRIYTKRPFVSLVPGTL